MKKTFLLVLFFLAGCVMPGLAPTPTLTPAPSATPPPTATPAPSATPTASLTPEPAWTATPAFTPTPAWAVQGPGSVTCLILLYHRIETPPFYNEYYVSPENFRAQMQALKDWGYTVIPMSLLVRGIREGAPLPARPVIISFDDGDLTVYTTAYPIMREFGYVGINYLVANRLDAEGYMNPEQVRELAQAGWEVGSHSMTHKNLLESEDPAWQIYQSRLELETALGLPVTTFAYPFGAMNEGIMETTRDYYDAAVGLGPQFEQTTANLYYLWRRPVKYEWDVETFGKFLLWNSPP